MMKDGRKAKYVILESIAFVCLLAAGLGLRIYQMPTEMYGVGTYFDAAAVGNYKAVPYIMGTGISQIYLYMLRGLFSIFGNVWQVGTIAQLVLFMLGIMVFYFAVRKVNGSVGSLVIIGCVLCLPLFVPITYLYGPQMLYFLLFSVGLYYNHVLVKDAENRKELGILYILQTIITGLYGGLLIYLDIFSLLLVVPVIFIPLLMKKDAGVGKGLTVSLLWVLSAVVAVLGCGFGESLLAKSTLMDVMSQWMKNSYLCDRHIWLGSIMAAVYLSMAVYFIIYMLFKRTSRAVRELDVEGLLENHTESAPEIVAEQSKVEAETVAVASTSVKEEKVTESVSEEPKPVIQLLENPLPLPKKHVKKTLGYAFEPDFEDMDYDVKVSEKDDFDLK